MGDEIKFIQFLDEIMQVQRGRGRGGGGVLKLTLLTRIEIDFLQYRLYMDFGKNQSTRVRNEKY